MERDELRLECLKLAASRVPSNAVEETVARGEQFFEFCIKDSGKQPIKSPKDAQPQRVDASKKPDNINSLK